MRVAATASSPIATTADRANIGSPTRPGPCPELRGSPPATPGLGDAANVEGGKDQPRPGHRQDAEGAARARHATAPAIGQDTRQRDQPEPADHAGGGDQRSPSLTTGEDAHRLVGLEGRQDQRPAEARRHSWLACRVEDRNTEHDRVLDRRDLIDPKADRGGRGGARRDAIGDIRGRPDRFTRDDDQPGIEDAVVDGDRVEAFPDLEVDALAAVLERHPRAVGPELESCAAEDQWPMRLVLELVIGVDPATDPDVPSGPGRKLARLARW